MPFPHNGEISSPIFDALVSTESEREG